MFTKYKCMREQNMLKTILYNMSVVQDYHVTWQDLVTKEQMFELGIPNIEKRATHLKDMYSC